MPLSCWAVHCFEKWFTLGWMQYLLDVAIKQRWHSFMCPRMTLTVGVNIHEGPHWQPHRRQSRVILEIIQPSYICWPMCRINKRGSDNAKCSIAKGSQGAVSIRKTVLPGMAIPMLKIRRPTGRLIFNMGIAIPGKTVFLIETLS